MSLAGSFNGLSFGPGTKVHVSTLEGLADLPEVRQSDVLRGQRFGTFKGLNLLGQRAVLMDLSLRGDDHNDFLTQYAAVEAATVPQDPEQTITEIPLYLLGSTRVVFARVVHRTLPVETDHYQRTGVCNLEFLASDPRIYDAVLQSGTIAAAASSGGYSFPYGYPYSYGAGGGSSGVIEAMNAGSMTTYPVATIQGACSIPAIYNNTLNRWMRINLTLAATDSLVVDFLNRTIILNGSASRRAAMTSDSTWWGIAAGATNEIAFSAASSSGASLTLAWRSAWSGATA